MPEDIISKWLGIARQKLASAAILLDEGQRLDSMYIAGYAPECAIKALILSLLPDMAHESFINAYFKRAEGHKLETLRQSYRGLFRSNYLKDKLEADQLRQYLLDMQLWDHQCLLKKKRPWDLLTIEYLQDTLTPAQFEAFQDDEQRCDMDVTTAEAFERVASWGVDLRYDSKEVPEDDARVFLASAEKVVSWAERTISCHRP